MDASLPGLWTALNSDVAWNVQELEGLEDPTKQEVADIRKKIEVVDRELRPMKQLCEKKVRKKHYSWRNFLLPVHSLGFMHLGSS